jgi:hypothetical protein
MVAAVGIIPVSLDLLRGNEDVFPVFPAQRVDAPLDPPYLGRVAVGVVAASQHRIVRHVPTRIELLVEEQIPRRMTMCAILSGLVRLRSRHQRKRQRDRQEELATTVQRAASRYRIAERSGSGDWCLRRLRPKQPSAIAFAARPEAIETFPGAKRRSPGIIPDQAELPAADGAAFCGGRALGVFGLIAHDPLLLASDGRL